MFDAVVQKANTIVTERGLESAVYVFAMVGAFSVGDAVYEGGKMLKEKFFDKESKKEGDC